MHAPPHATSIRAHQAILSGPLPIPNHGSASVSPAHPHGGSWLHTSIRIPFPRTRPTAPAFTHLPPDPAHVSARDWVNLR